MGRRKRFSGMFKKEIYTIKEVLNKTFLTGTREKLQRTRINDQNIVGAIVEFDGDLINMTSQRYQMFKLKGTCCVKCGLEAEYFTKERPKVKKNFDPTKVVYHFNLYGNKDGKEILFTKDHIIPKVKGGKNHMDNYQVMCQPCNQDKDDKIVIYEAQP
jgi:hypothetical protein